MCYNTQTAVSIYEELGHVRKNILQMGGDTLHTLPNHAMKYRDTIPIQCHAMNGGDMLK